MRLQQTRNLLYKTRMTKLEQTLQQNFFASLGEASQILRLFDFLPDIYLYLKDTQGRFTAVNESLVRLRGVKSECDLLGKTDLEIHPVFWGRKYQQEDQQVIESGREIQNQVWLVPGGDGKLASFASSKIPLRANHGEVIGLAGVMYSLNEQTTTTRYPDAVQIATELINRNYADPIEIQHVAKCASLSTSQLNRRFQTKYQMSPSEYLQRVRIHHASQALIDTETQIGIIALQNGFYDQAHLTRLFRRWMGLTPLEFRRESRPKPMFPQP